MTRAVLAALPLVWLCTAAPQKPAPPAAGTISGILTSADLGQPIRKAQVRLMTPGTRTPRVTTTDGDGRYVFSNVPPGTYVLSASRAGYLDMARGARRPAPAGAGVPLTIAAGQKLDDISWTMPRAGVITGIVLDEFGDPAFNVPVRAMRFDFSPGHRSITHGGNGVTDDRGVYRIAGLPPGEYLVAAVPRDNVADAATRAEFVRDRQAEVIAAAKARGVPSNAAAAPEPPSAVGYVATYYPGTPTGAAAATVNVGISEEVSGIDIRLPIVKTSTISGRIASAEGVIPTSRLQLIDASMPLSLVGVWFRDARADGSFDFHGVVPGSYTVKAFGTPGGPKGAAGGQMWGSVDVSVDERGASDVVLTMQRGVTVSGRVALEDLPAATTRSQLRVSLDPVQGPADWEMAPVGFVFDATGSFTAANVLPGRYRLNAVGLPDGWSIDSAAFGDRDAADHHLVVDGSRNLTGIVRFSSRTGTLSGGVTNADGSPNAHRTVLVFTTERALWLPRSRRIHLAQPDADGRFTIRGLPPGDYFAVALLDLEPGRQFDPEFLAQTAAIATTVTVAAGGPRSVDLKVR